MKQLTLWLAAALLLSISLVGCSEPGDAASAQDQVKLRDEYKKANPDDKSY
ncbi:MAG: hypothetical protein MUC92_12215 [Fimbriimonadaceae bacterium]|jgi:hypothetical protein|nr:hypothetical protein [Fimbriimonadaceae bacterium]